MSFNDFTLVPADDPQSSPQQDLDAAVAGALALSDAVVPAEPDPPVPFGRSWRFDWELGQFVRRGQSPVDVAGFEALEEVCQMAIHSARYAHPVFSPDFGMEEPDSVIGEFAEGEALADWERHLVEALMTAHDRIATVENVELTWDPVEGVLTIDTLDVVTDEDERLTISDVTLQAGGSP